MKNIYFYSRSKDSNINLLAMLFKLPHFVVWMCCWSFTMLNETKQSRNQHKLFAMFVVLCCTYSDVGRSEIYLAGNNRLLLVCHEYNERHFKNHWLLNSCVSIFCNIILLLVQGIEMGFQKGGRDIEKTHS